MLLSAVSSLIAYYVVASSGDTKVSEDSLRVDRCFIRDNAQGVSLGMEKGFQEEMLLELNLGVNQVTERLEWKGKGTASA